MRARASGFNFSWVIGAIMPIIFSTLLDSARFQIVDVFSKIVGHRRRRRRLATINWRTRMCAALLLLLSQVREKKLYRCAFCASASILGNARRAHSHIGTHAKNNSYGPIIITWFSARDNCVTFGVCVRASFVAIKNKYAQRTKPHSALGIPQ